VIFQFHSVNSILIPNFLFYCCELISVPVSVVVLRETIAVSIPINVKNFTV